MSGVANRKVAEDFWRCFSATDTGGARAYEQR